MKTGLEQITTQLRVSDIHQQVWKFLQRGTKQREERKGGEGEEERNMEDEDGEVIKGETG